MIWLAFYIFGVAGARWLIRRRSLGPKHKLGIALLWPILVLLVVCVIVANLSLDDRHLDDQHLDRVSSAPTRHRQKQPNRPLEEETEIVL